MPKRNPKNNGDIVLKPITTGYFRRIVDVLRTKGKVLGSFMEEKKKERKL